VFISSCGYIHYVDYVNRNRMKGKKISRKVEIIENKILFEIITKK
jgi:hypothetical protein